MKSIIKYPYGDKDSYASVSLIASTRVHSDKYTVDQAPALAARVSNAQSGKTGDNPEADKKLMKYLADNLHMTPFEHQSATFKVIIPLFIARHWIRHRTQSYNEVSTRYTSDHVGKVFYPITWREQSAKNKQSSADSVSNQEECRKILKDGYDHAINTYNKLLEKGVCREQARLIVPLGNYTEFYATANLRNWAAFYKLRIAQDAQWEISQYARCIGEILDEIWPNSWSVLK